MKNILRRIWLPVLACILAASDVSGQGLTFTGSVEVTGNLKAAGLSVTGSVDAAAVTTTGSIGVLGNLYVAGSVLLPNLSITSLANLTAITVSNNITTANLSVTGSVSMGGSVVMSPTSSGATITIGSSAGTGAIYLGNSSAPQSVNIAGGTGIYYVGIGSNTLGPATLYLGNTLVNTGAVNVVVGTNTNQPNVTTIQGGNGTGAIALTPQTTGTIVIGAGAGTGDITVGASSAAQTLNLGTGSGVATINIGTGNASSVINLGGVLNVTALATSGTFTAGGNINGQIINGTTSLQLRQTGDTFGESGMFLYHRNGSNGGIIYTGNNVDLVDLGFLSNTTNSQYNMRFEHRSASLTNASNTTGEFQLFNTRQNGVDVGTSFASFGASVVTLSGLVSTGNISTTTAGGIDVGSGGVRVPSTGSGIGYTTGSTVTQATNKSTGVTINALSGKITMNGAALAAGAEASFLVTNNTVGANDVPVVAVSSGGTANTYMVGVHTVSAGSFTIIVTNVSTTSRSEAIVLNFAIIKGS